MRLCHTAPLQLTLAGARRPRPTMPSSKTGSEYWIDGSHREMALEDFYVVGPELGRGATSVVYSCEEKGTGAPYAAKILKKTIDKKIVRTEIGVLLRLSHPNIAVAPRRCRGGTIWTVLY